MRRTTWILLALVLGALAAILFWERKQAGTADREAGALKLCPDFPELDEVTALERGGEDPVSLVRAGAAWRVTTPLEDAADAQGIEGFMERLRDAKAVRFLDPPVPWKALGLDAPRLRWTLMGGPAVLQVALGAQADLGQGVYLRVGDRAALVPQDLADMLQRAVDEFRSKDLLPPGSGTVQTFRIEREGAPVLAGRRSGEAWVLEEPYADLADPARVDSLLDDLRYAPVGSFEKAGADLAAYGLDRPRAVVRWTFDGGRAADIRIGMPAPGGEAPPPGMPGNLPAEERVYASVAGRPSVMVIPARVLRGLEADPETLRSMDLFRHQPFEAESLAVDGAYAVRLRRDGRGSWAFEAPTRAPKGKDAAPLAEALLSLRAAAALPAPAPAAPPAPYVTVTLRGKGFEERVAVGIEREGKRYARPAGRAVTLLLEAESWRSAEDALKAIPLAPEAKK